MLGLHASEAVLRARGVLRRGLSRRSRIHSDGKLEKHAAVDMRVYNINRVQVRLSEQFVASFRLETSDHKFGLNPDTAHLTLKAGCADKST